jgi:DNA end-binding protein Ku
LPSYDAQTPFNLRPFVVEMPAFESTRTTNIDEFVPREEIHPRYIIRPHYIVPDGKVGHDAFVYPPG